MKTPFQTPVAEWRPSQGIALLLLCLLLLLIPLTLLNLHDLHHNEQLFLERYRMKLDQDLLLQTRHMREQVINVQQWLTDISVTRGLDGLDQGFKQAQQSAALFHEGLSILRTILGKRNPGQSFTAWSEGVARDFDIYLRTGTEMADAYIRSGTLEGNLRMRQFDGQAEALHKRFADLVDKQPPPEGNRPASTHREEIGWFRLARIWQLLMGGEHYAAYVQVQQQLAKGLSQREVSQLAQQAQALREDVLQTQQWLTDVSATRAQDGMDDGFQLAQERADHFFKHIGPFRALLQSTGDPQSLATVDRLEQAFPLYYATGLAMAKSYIHEGTHQGNALMQQFDQQSTELVDALRPFLGKMLEKVGLEEFQVVLARQAIENTLTLLKVVLALLLLLLAGTGWWFFRSS
ncbi:MAG: hypothetical protein H7835_15605 [Magnetococcus sp. XQGC-1]